MVITAIARLLLAKPTCFCVVIYVCNVYLKYDNTSSLRKINLKNIYWTSMMLSKRARLKGLIELCMEFYFNRTTVRTESQNIRGNHIYYLSTEFSCHRCNKKKGPISAYISWSSRSEQMFLSYHHNLALSNIRSLKLAFKFTCDLCNLIGSYRCHLLMNRTIFLFLNASFS